MVLTLLKKTLPSFFTLFLILFGHQTFATQGSHGISISDIDILAISDELKNALDAQIRPIRNQENRTNKLHDLLFGPNGIGYNIKYNAEKTYTADETFKTLRGNCISLSSLFVASARYVGLKAQFQTATVPRDWEKEDSFYVVPGHVNVAITLANREGILVEFLGTYRSKNLKSKKISDERALAEYYNNIGMEFLTEGKYGHAVAYLEKSTKTYSKLAFTWSNLGVAYKKQKQYIKAEAAYSKALDLSPNDQSTIKNLYVLYSATDQKDKAKKYKELANNYAKKNPYYLAKLAAQSYNTHDYKTAQKLLRKAIKKKPEEEIFHFQIARTYFKQGKLKKAETHLTKAKDLADDDKNKTKYERKIGELKNILTRNKSFSHDNQL